MRRDELKVGDIFNKIYVGENDAYGRCNGKTTNIMTKIEGDKIEMREFYAFLGYCLNPQCMSNTIYWNMSSMLSQNYEIIKIKNPEKKGFIHHKVLNLKECSKLGIIDKKVMMRMFKSQKGDFIRESNIVHHSFYTHEENPETNISGHKVSFSYGLEPFTHPNYPYLILISFVYNNSKELYEDIEAVFKFEPYRFS